MQALRGHTTEQPLRAEVVEDAYAHLLELVRRYADAPEGSAEARDALADLIEAADEDEDR